MGASRDIRTYDILPGHVSCVRHVLKEFLSMRMMIYQYRWVDGPINPLLSSASTDAYEAGSCLMVCIRALPCGLFIPVMLGYVEEAVSRGGDRSGSNNGESRCGAKGDCHRGMFRVLLHISCIETFVTGKDYCVNSPFADVDRDTLVARLIRWSIGSYIDSCVVRLGAGSVIVDSTDDHTCDGV